MSRYWVSVPAIDRSCDAETDGGTEDPFPDPPNMIPEPASPIRPPDALLSGVARISDDENPFEEVAEEAADATRRQTAAASSALTLEMIGEARFYVLA